MDADHGILTQAWSPIGGIIFCRDGNHGSTLNDPVIGGIATRSRQDPVEVMLSRGLQHGRSVIPKSPNPSRIAENINMSDFELSVDEMAANFRTGSCRSASTQSSDSGCARESHGDLLLLGLYQIISFQSRWRHFDRPQRRPFGHRHPYVAPIGPRT